MKAFLSKIMSTVEAIFNNVLNRKKVVKIVNKTVKVVFVFSFVFVLLLQSIQYTGIIVRARVPVFFNEVGMFYEEYLEQPEPV